jgi:hypothetical protein
MDKKIKKSVKTNYKSAVLATGLNNTNGDINKSDFRYLGSHFYEWGITYNTRISKKQ